MPRVQIPKVRGNKRSEEFKKTIVTLYQSGKAYSEIKKEYGISSSALANWVRKYSQVRVNDDTVLTAQQMKAFRRRNAELEEENLILKIALTPVKVECTDCYRK